MKVLMVNDYIHTIGGAEIYMHSISDALRSQGHTVEIFASTVDKKKYIRKLQHPTIADLLKRIWNFEQLKQFKKVYNDFKPDIIHIHSFFNELSPSFLSAVTTTPCIMTLHDERIAVAATNQEARTGKKCARVMCPGCLNCVGFKGMVFEKVRRFVQSLVLHKIKVFITPSIFLYNRIEQNTTIRPLQQLYNGFQLLPQKPPTFQKNIAFIGRLSPDKGVEYLVKAMEIVHRELPNATVSIVGNGEELVSLRHLTKLLQLERIITFYNEVPHTKVAEYIYNADIVCIPSTYPDNLPTVCIEAISAGRPVVASRIGGLPELVEHKKTGLLVKPHDADALARALLLLLRDKKILSAFAEQGHKNSQRFTIHIHLKEIITIYQNYGIKKRT